MERKTERSIDGKEERERYRKRDELRKFIEGQIGKQDYRRQTIRNKERKVDRKIERNIDKSNGGKKIDNSYIHESLHGFI